MIPRMNLFLRINLPRSLEERIFLLMRNASGSQVSFVCCTVTVLEKEHKQYGLLPLHSLAVSLAAYVRLTRY